MLRQISVSCCVSCLCLWIGLAALGKVDQQVINELLLLFIAILPGAAGSVRNICTCFHVLVQRHQCLVVLL